VARLLHGDGYKIVAASDSTGAIFSNAGFDIPRLIYGKQQTRKLKAVYCNGTLCETLEAETLTNDALLELDVDILVPAALENQITGKNADRIKAHVFVEVANGPTTSEAGRVLRQKGVLVIPDILANAGGVTVSYFKWV